MSIFSLSLASETANLTLALIIIAWVIFGFALIYFGVGAVLSVKLLRPKKRTDEHLAKYESEQKGLDLARLDIPYEDIRLRSKNAAKYVVRGRLYLCGDSKKTVIDCHGYNSSSLSQLKYLHIWQALGYNVLLPDNTFSGESQGENIGMGYLERQDIMTWLDYLSQRFPDHSFGLYGESMGGAGVIGAAARTAVKLSFTITYCTYATLSKLAKDQLKAHKLPKIVWMFAPAVYVMAYLFFGVKLMDVDSQRDIKLVNCPIMLMHSKGDRLIDVSNVHVLAGERPDATVKIYEESPHCRSWKYYPEEFEAAIKDFVKKAEALGGIESPAAEREIAGDVAE